MGRHNSCNNRTKKEILGRKSQKKGEAGAEQQAVLYSFVLLGFWGDFGSVLGQIIFEFC